MFALRSMAGALRSFWSGGQPIERVGYTVGALLIVSGSIHLAILIVTGGSWEGPLSLRKPSARGRGVIGVRIRPRAPSRPFGLR